MTYIYDKHHVHNLVDELLKLTKTYSYLKFDFELVIMKQIAINCELELTFAILSIVSPLKKDFLESVTTVLSIVHSG